MAIRDMVPFGHQRRRHPHPAHRSEQRGDPIEAFHREIDRLFGDFFGNMLEERRETPGALGETWGPFEPRVDVQDKDKELVVTAEIPGVSEDDLDIQLEDNTIVLRGEKEYADEYQEGTSHTRERSYGSFIRRVPLPVEVDEDNASAKFKNGVVTIRVPKLKSVEGGGKRVEIERE